MGDVTAFPGPYAIGTPEMNKYDEYLQNQNGLMANQNNEPAASPGALSGEASPEAEPALQGAAMQPSAEQVFGEEYGQGGKDFFSHWQKANTEEKEQLTANLEEMPNAAGKSLEGLMQEAYAQNPDVATEIGAKYGFSPPNKDGGMPNFKLEQRALGMYDETMMKGDLALAKGEQVLGEIDEMNKKDDAKREKRHAMGAFLFEAGLRILASNRGDAGGAIAEGVLGTMEARQARKEHAEDRTMAKEDRARKQGFEDSAEARAESAEGRAKSKEEREAAAEARRQEIHEAQKKAGTLALGGGGKTAFQIQKDVYIGAHLPEGVDSVEDLGPEERKKLERNFLSYYNRESRITPSQRATILNKIKEQISEGEVGYDGEKDWFELTAKEQDAYVMSQVPWLSEDGGKGASEAEDYDTLDW